VEFYAMVRHVSLSITQRTKVYAHGLQITAALADVMDEFDMMIHKYAKGEIKPHETAGAGIVNQPSEDRTKAAQDGATLAN
jgi:hypothetical protein